METRKHQTKLSLNIDSTSQFPPLNQDLYTDNNSFAPEENNLEDVINDDVSLLAITGLYVSEPGNKEKEMNNRKDYYGVLDTTSKQQNNNKTHSKETKTTNLSESHIDKNTSILNKWAAIKRLPTRLPSYIEGHRPTKT